MRVQNKSIIVTGAGNGIGEGIAKRLAQEGAQVLRNGLPPAACHAGAHHALQRGPGLRAVLQRVGIHGGFDGMHHQLAVNRHAQPHVVDGVTRQPDALVAKRGHVVRLAVVQFGFHVPQPVFTFVALVGDAADMAGFTRDGS